MVRARSKKNKKSAAAASKRNRRVKPGRFVLLAIAAIGAAAASVTFAKPQLKEIMTAAESADIRNIVVKGAEQFNGSDVLVAAGIGANMDMAKVNVEAVKQAFRNNVWVEKVKVSRWTGKLMVSVTERRPIVLVSVGNVYQMDRAGVLLPLPVGDYLNAPVVCGLTDTVDATKVRRIRPGSLATFLRFWDALGKKNPSWARSVAQLDFTKENTVRLTLEAHTTRIEIGLADTEAKIDQVSSMLEAMRDDNNRQPRVINLRYENLAFVE